MTDGELIAAGEARVVTRHSFLVPIMKVASSEVIDRIWYGTGRRCAGWRDP